MAVDAHAPTQAMSSSSGQADPRIADHELRIRVVEAQHGQILGGLRVLQWMIGFCITVMLACTGWLVMAHRDALTEIDSATTAIAASAAAKQVREEAVNEKITDHAQRIRWLESAQTYGD